MTAFVVPFGYDGASDRAARAFAAAFARAGGGELAIENAAGEGGLLGVTRGNALAREGREVLLLSTPTTHVLLPARLGRDAAPDAKFAAFLGLGSAPNVLLAASRLGVESVDALVALARRDRLTYASAGAGQTIDMCTRRFLREAGLEMTHRPYDRGSVLAYAGLAAGDADIFFDNALACGERIAAGEVRPLAVSSARRWALLPQVPALAECGFPGYALDVWLGVFAANLPASAAEIPGRLLADDAFERALAALGLPDGPLGAPEFARAVEDSAAAWGQVRA